MVASQVESDDNNNNNNTVRSANLGKTEKIEEEKRNCEKKPHTDDYRITSSDGQFSSEFEITSFFKFKNTQQKKIHIVRL